MIIQRSKYTQVQKKREINTKLQLERALMAMEYAVTKQKEVYDCDESALTLQRAFKNIMNRKRFHRRFLKLKSAKKTMQLVSKLSKLRPLRLALAKFKASETIPETIEGHKLQRVRSFTENPDPGSPEQI